MMHGNLHCICTCIHFYVLHFYFKYSRLRGNHLHEPYNHALWPAYDSKAVSACHCLLDFSSGSYIPS